MKSRHFFSALLLTALHLLSLPPPASSSSANCVYTLYVQTGSIIKAGTDARISIALGDSSGGSVWIPDLTDWGLMGRKHDYFERGNLDVFTGRGPCIGRPICRLNVTSDGSGNHHGWFCDYVEVTSTGPHMGCGQSIFYVDQWLATDAPPYQLSAEIDGCHQKAQWTVKFAPKGPPSRAPQPLTAKSETAAQDDSDDEQTQQFLSRKVHDYKHSYYPTTLPWRRPYSGDPEEHDKAEFEEASEYDENNLSSASDLGLLVGRRQNGTNKRETADDLKALESGVFSVASKGKEIIGSAPRVSGCSLEELPEGYMGKMLVYKSGAVKLKLGDILYDVSPGSDCAFAQSVMAIDTTNRDCCDLGALNKRAVVTPDIDFLVDNVIDLG
ncbi:UNVERIFIED_CONTAM: PLAT domain-containing protein 1 [Sesamum radiatum]|uniref:PLAT domain-containing protein 1 n=1 Tax=Sesamum radiatum TaxID=300843 RepID=A0AAW2JVX6_SESRA